MKNYVLVGVGSLIGQHTAGQLLEQGHLVYGTSRSDVSLNHKNFNFVKLNAVEDALLDDFLPAQIDGLVYFPGTINLKPFRALKEADFLQEYRVNVLGAVRAIQWTHSRFVQGSSVVLFSTVAVQRGMPFHASIASAKGAVEGLVRSLAAEFAPKVRVNAIAPSLTRTPLADRLINNETKLQASKERHPMKEVGMPEDLAEMAVFLLSGKAGWITVQIMHVDGGLSVI
jgi:NAD(P)-dependent dehydrogenase (short-subunit alcohol dehydrogenase family)